MFYAFLIKKTLLYAERLSKQKKFSNCQAAYQKELFLLFEKSGNFFHRVNIEIGLTPPPPVSFRLL